MISLRRIAIILAAAALTTGAGKPAPQGNWIAHVEALPSGAHRIGNPQAKVRLVEYVSYTCPHCAEFEKAASGELAIGMVHGGKGSVEYRPYLRDIPDITASLLVSCGDPKRFALNHSVVLRSQEKWIGNFTEAALRRWLAIPDFATRMRAVAGDMKFYDLFEARGYQRVDLDKCLANEELSRKIAFENRGAESVGAVNGTPSFLINDVPQDGHSWADLRPALAVLTR